jgi:hypothetical protein
MKYHFLVNVSVEPDEDESREQMYERLGKVLEASTAREALSIGCRATVELKLAEEASPAMITIARGLYEESSGDIEIDDHAAVSLCVSEPYDWVAAWVSVPSE